MNKTESRISRRAFIKLAGLTALAPVISACDRILASPEAERERLLTEAYRRDDALTFTNLSIEALPIQDYRITDRETQNAILNEKWNDVVDLRSVGADPDTFGQLSKNEQIVIANQYIGLTLLDKMQASRFIPLRETHNFLAKNFLLEDKEPTRNGLVKLRILSFEDNIPEYGTQFALTDKLFSPEGFVYHRVNLNTDRFARPDGLFSDFDLAFTLHHELLGHVAFGNQIFEDYQRISKNTQIPDFMFNWYTGVRDPNEGYAIWGSAELLERFGEIEPKFILRGSWPDIVEKRKDVISNSPPGFDRPLWLSQDWLNFAENFVIE